MRLFKMNFLVVPRACISMIHTYPGISFLPSPWPQIIVKFRRDRVVLGGDKDSKEDNRFLSTMRSEWSKSRHGIEKNDGTSTLQQLRHGCGCLTLQMT